MNLHELIHQLTQILATIGDLPVVKERLDEGLDDNCIVHLVPLTFQPSLRDVGVTHATGFHLVCECRPQHECVVLSELIPQLKRTLATQPGARIDVVVAADDGGIDVLDRIEIVADIDQLGPFFIEDVVDVDPTLFPCIVVRTVQAL